MVQKIPRCFAMFRIKACHDADLQEKGKVPYRNRCGKHFLQPGNKELHAFIGEGYP